MNSTNSLYDFGLVLDLGTMVSILIIHIITGVPLNCYVIILHLSKGEKDISGFFALNHAVAEILFSLSSLPFVICAFHQCYYVSGLSEIIFMSIMSVRNFNQCCVSLEQYLAVIHPVIFLKFKPLRYHVVCSILVWLCAIALGNGIVYLLLSPFKVFSFVYCIILVIQLFCCGSILKGLRHPAPGDKEKKEMCAAKKKAFQVVFINLLTFLIQNVPVAVVFGLENVLGLRDFAEGLIICTAMNTFTGLLQPIFFLHKAGKLSFVKCA